MHAESVHENAFRLSFFRTRTIFFEIFQKVAFDRHRFAMNCAA